MRIAPLFIATSLATLFASNLALMGSARAATMDPREVTLMLAHSQALDNHCKILSATEAQDLRDLVARAEIALAGKYSVAVARETLAKGRADGKAAPCDAAASAQVRDILKAGMMATTQEPVAPTTEQSAAATPAPAPQIAASKPKTPNMPPSVVAPKKMIVAQKPVAAAKLKQRHAALQVTQSVTQVTTKVKAEKKVSLASYSSLAQKYYVELKCHTMPLHAAQRMYEDVLAQHRAAMASDGATAVRKMLKNAQSRAGAQSCT